MIGGTMSDKGTGEFFAVDRRTWAKVCELGMNPAVAYLVLARFSGRDNSTTAASTNAIEKRTGVARSRAREAIGKLIEKQLVKQTQGGSKPRYELVPYAPPAVGIAFRNTPLTPREQEAFDAVARGEKPRTRPLKAAASSACSKGWLGFDWSKGGTYSVCEDPRVEPDWIWLPNALVTGLKDESPMVERVRQTAQRQFHRLSRTLDEAPAQRAVRSPVDPTAQLYAAQWTFGRVTTRSPGGACAAAPRCRARTSGV
jgi:hypothetical protein